MRLYPEEINSVVISNGGALNMTDFLKYVRRVVWGELLYMNTATDSYSEFLPKVSVTE